MDLRTLAALAIAVLLALALESHFMRPEGPQRELEALRAEVLELKASMASLRQMNSNLTEVRADLMEVKTNLTWLQDKHAQTARPKRNIWLGQGERRERNFSSHCMKVYRSLLPVTSINQEECRAFQFIHVAKNGGTALETWLKQNNLECLVTSFEHVDMRTSFMRRPKGTCYLTMARDPVERWVSGFLSRWRRGCPSHCGNWSRPEEHVFRIFSTPEQLAAAFSSQDVQLRSAADLAHSTIHHLHRGFAAYFPQLEAVLPFVVYVGLTCDLKRAAIAMLHAIGVPEQVMLNLTEVPKVHANPDADLANLSQLAIRNVKHKMREDYEVLKGLAQAKLIDSENVAYSCRRITEPMPESLQQKVYQGYFTCQSTSFLRTDPTSVKGFSLL